MKIYLNLAKCDIPLPSCLSSECFYFCFWFFWPFMKSTINLIRFSHHYYESFWPLCLFVLLLILCSQPPDTQAWKLRCPGTEASCGGGETGWWRWQCGGCPRHSGQPCSLWLRPPWTGDLRHYFNCSDVVMVVVGIQTIQQEHWHTHSIGAHFKNLKLISRWWRKWGGRILVPNRLLPLNHVEQACCVFSIIQPQDSCVRAG